MSPALAGLLTGLVLAGLGLGGSYLISEPPVQSASGIVVYNAGTILGLLVLFTLGFAGGYSSVKESRPRR